MNYPNLRKALISLLFLIPFVGLIVSTSLFFPYITGKNIAFRLLVEAAAILYVWLALRDVSYRPKVTSITIAFLSFLGVLFAADVFAEYPLKAFFSNFERMEGFVTLAHLFAYFIMIGSVFTTEKLWKRFFQVSLLSSVFMGLFGLAQLDDPSVGGRIYAQLGNSTYLAAFMLFNIFIATFLLVRQFQEKDKTSLAWHVVAYGGVIALDLVVFYYTGTRGALLGLLAGALFISTLFAVFEKNKALRFSGAGVLAIIILVVVLLAGFKQSEFIQNNRLLSRFAALATFDKEELAAFVTTQGKSRLAIWGIALEGFKERPILGWGQDNFNYVFNKYYDPKIYDQEQWFDRAHNVFFDWLVAGGILGLLSYLSLFVLCVVSIWRSKINSKDSYFLFSDKVILTAVLIAYFIHNLFVFDSITSYILFFAILAFVHFHEKGLPLDFLSRPLKDQKYVQAGSAAAAILLMVVFYHSVYLPYATGRSLIGALSYQNYALSQGVEGALGPAYNSYQKALSYGGAGKGETREQLIQGANTIIFSSVATTTTKIAFAEFADAEMKKQIQETPNDARYELFYGNFLNNLARSGDPAAFGEAVRHLERAHELSPKKQTILYELASVYLNSGDFEKGIEYFKHAFDLEQNNNEARFLYGMSLIYTNNNALADEILAPLQGTPYLGDSRLIRAYHESNQDNKVILALEYKFILAERYAKEGNRAGALQQLQEIMSLTPAYNDRAEAMIAELQK